MCCWEYGNYLSMETRDLYGDIWISMILYGFLWMAMGLYGY